MGVFLIYKKDQNSLVNKDKVKDIYKRKGLDSFIIVETANYDYLIGKNKRKFFDRIEYRNIEIFAFGTFIYKSKSRDQALDTYIQDLFHDAIDKKATVGFFQLLIIDKINDTYKVIHDESRTFDLYHLNENKQVVSNSFITLFKGVNSSYSIDKQSLIQNVMLGYIIGNGTLLNEIRKVDKNQVFENIKSIDLNKSLSTGKLIQKLNNIYWEISDSFKNEVFDIGLSGGYDSRLNLLLGKDKMKFSPHTHVKKFDNSDYNISKILAKKCELELRTFRSEFVGDKNSADKDKLLNDSFYFYDGRVSINTGFLNDIYTREYRENIVDDINISLSGFGGEIFRNYSSIPNKSMKIDDWLNHFIINPFKMRAFKSKRNRLDFKASIKSLLISDNFLMRNQKKVSFDDMMDYYYKIWLKYALSTKIFAENQLLYYLMPLIDSRITEHSSFIKSEIKKDSFFEAKLIEKLSFDIASVPSNYGYSFSRIPTKDRLKTKIYSSNVFFNIKKELYAAKSFKNSIDDEFTIGLMDLVFEELDIDIDRNIITSNKTWAYNIASIGYFIKEFKKNGEN